MSEEPRGFSQAKMRLEEIVSQVRKKDTSLEASLDLLEEGVRLANQCTELIDQADWEAARGVDGDAESEVVGADSEELGADGSEDVVPEPLEPRSDPDADSDDTVDERS